MAKKKSNRQEGWKIVKRTVTPGLGGPGVERFERVRTHGVLKKLGSAFFDEMYKIANRGEEDMKGRAPSEEAVLKFLKKTPSPTDKRFHEWAESSGFNIHKAEQTAYKIVSDLIHKGKSEGKLPPGIPASEVRAGMRVEKEHTPSPVIARKVVADHHAEAGPGYYPALKKMEEMLKRKK